MEAVVSLFEPAVERMIHQLWDELEDKCGLYGVQSSPIPHLTWHAASQYQREAVINRLAGIASQLTPMTVISSGLGIFSGPTPVIYIPVSKTCEFVKVHKQLWEALEPVAVHSNPYYATDDWVPHITLAYGDVNPEKLACAIQRLAFQKYEWLIKICNLALISQEEDQLGQVVESFAYPDVEVK